MRRFVAWALVVASAGAAIAEVDVTVGNGVKAVGSFDPGAETETYRFVAPAGAVVSVSAKGKKARGAATGPAPRLALRDPDGQSVGTTFVEATTTGAKLAGYTLHDSGEYSVAVTSEGQIVGDYQIQVAWKVPKKVSFDGTVTAAPAQFTISLPAGAVATLTASAPKGSIVRPWVSQMEGGEFSQGFTPPPASMKHKVTAAEAPF